MPDPTDTAIELFNRGGPVMWPLLALSVIAGAAIIERSAFWLRLHRPGRRTRNERLAQLLRRHDAAAVEAATAGDNSLYAHAARELAQRQRETASRPAHAPGDGGAIGVELVEAFRPDFERFHATLTTVITAAPYLGILGTVLGIIDAFDLLGEGQAGDITQVAAGIAQALITTAAGLVIALAALFPTMVFRAQAERCLGSLERLAASALSAPPPASVRAEDGEGDAEKSQKSG